MARSSAQQNQLNLPPSLLLNHAAAPNSGALAAPAVSLLPNQAHLTIGEAEALSSQLVDAALTVARISNGEAAFALGIKDESLIRKMRSPQNRERMSHAQMLVLGSVYPRFYVELNAALDARTGWFRQFALELMQRASAFFAMAGR